MIIERLTNSVAREAVSPLVGHLKLPVQALETDTISRLAVAKDVTTSVRFGRDGCYVRCGRPRWR